MELALVVSVWVLGGVVLMGILGYLIDKTAEPDDRNETNANKRS